MCLDKGSGYSSPPCILSFALIYFLLAKLAMNFRQAKVRLNENLSGAYLSKTINWGVKAYENLNKKVMITSWYHCTTNILSGFWYLKCSRLTKDNLWWAIFWRFQVKNVTLKQLSDVSSLLQKLLHKFMAKRLGINT